MITTTRGSRKTLCNHQESSFVRVSQSGHAEVCWNSFLKIDINPICMYRLNLKDSIGAFFNATLDFQEYTAGAPVPMTVGFTPQMHIEPGLYHLFSQFLRFICLQTCFWLINCFVVCYFVCIYKSKELEIEAEIAMR
jgi:hypothetical protein